jgi:4-amino-4-deoxy-L-arabinose transferase-like glycosyltransferase
VRPALLLLAFLAGCAYAWGAANQTLEVYYAAAVRSMSLNWHNFLFAAFDPDATVSMDKLPGALWLQAISVKLFGFHIWALVLPQVIEGIMSVLVVFSTVRLLAGPHAALAAAAVLACTPAAVALNRGNISDSLLILLLLCATNAAVRALIGGRTGLLLVAGVWVGLAFQAKMLEAWLVLPGLALAWLVAGSGGVRRRLAAIAGLCVLAAAMSLVWIAPVSLVPQHDRPYVDGSQHDSLFEQVFDYNGFGRVDDGAAPQTAVLAGGLQKVTLDAESTLNRTIAGPGGRDIGWLLPASLAIGAATLVRRWRCHRHDLLRAGCILFGTWLVADLAAFAASSSLNAYYLAALAPPIAALIGIGSSTLVVTFQAREGRLAVLALAAATVGYEAWLLNPAGDAIRVFVPLCALALLAGAWAWHLRGRISPTMATLLAAGLVAPAVASISIVVNGWGPFDTPFEPATTAAMTQRLPGAALRVAHASLARLNAARGSARYVAATYTSLLAAPFIFLSGEEVLPIGGFTGTTPVPTLGQLRADIDAGDLRLVISPTSTDPRVVWIATHCFQLPNRALPAYYCQAGL